VHTGRPYDRAAEARLWEWSRVTQHLAGIVPLRSVDQSGKVSIYNKGHYVAYLRRGKDVYVMYDPDSNERVFADRDGRQLTRRPADQLSPDRVINLNVSHRR
jgi:hypothetical protein